MADPIDNTDGIFKIYIDKTLIQECNQSAAAIYKFDHGTSSEVTMSSRRQVSRILNQSLSADDVEIRNTAIQPLLLCTKAERVNNRCFLKFYSNRCMNSYIDFNLKPGKPDIRNVFIVYHLKAFDTNAYWTRNGLFGYDKFVSFLPPPNNGLAVSYGGNYVTIGTYKNKPNCSA